MAKCVARLQVSRPASAIVLSAAIALFAFQVRISSQTGFVARDPGVRGGAAGAGDPLPGLTPYELEYFNAGKEEFEEAEELDEGIGPRMNLDSCGGCHLQPALGGSSPAVNPQFAFANKDGGTDTVPPFITADGPVREARFIKNPDGTVVRWAVETGSTNALFRRGWRKDSLRAGDHITVDAFRAKDGSNTANANTVKLPDGRQVSGASSRGGEQ